MLTFEYGPIRCGGLATMVTALCKGMDKTRYRPVVALPRSGYAPPWPLKERRALPSCEAEIYDTPEAEVWLLTSPLLDDGGIYPVVRYIKKFDDFGECLAEALGELDADVIHLHDIFGYKCLYVARTLGIPTVLTVHRLHYDELHTAFAEMATVLLVDVVTTVSRSYLQENPRYFGPRPDAVAVMNGLDFEGWDLPEGQDVVVGRGARRARLLERFELPDRATFLYFGRLDSDQKGVEILLRAVRDHVPRQDFNLLIVGRGEEVLEQAVQRLASERKDDVRFVAGMDDVGEIRALMGAVDFVVLPSRYEPFGLVQLEAMVLGAIPIASRTGGLKDVIVDVEVDGGFGALFTPGDDVELAAAIERMSQLCASSGREAPGAAGDDEGHLAGMRRKARARALQFSARSMAEGYEAIYERLLASPSTRAGR